MIVTVVALLTLVAIGVPAALALDPKARHRLLLAEAFLLGCGVIALALFFLSIVGVRWSLVALAIAALSVTAVLSRFARFSSGQRATGNGERIAAWAIDLMTLLIAFGHARFTTLASLGEWDFWAIWGLKARTFFERGGIDWDFLENPANTFTHPDYPLLLPLVMDYLTLARGAWEDQYLGLIFTLFGVSTLLIVRELLERETQRPVIAALGALALTSSVFAARPGIAEGPLAAYITAALLLLRIGWRDGDDVRLRAGAVMLGLAALTKNEGVALLVAVVIASVVFLRARWREVLKLWPALAIAATWLIPRALHQLPTDLFSGPTLSERVLSHLSTLPDLGIALAKHPPAQPVIWLAIVATLVWRARLAARRELFILTAALIQLIFYLGSYIVGPHEFEWHVATSWARLVSQIEIPLAFVAMTLLFADEESDARNIE